MVVILHSVVSHLEFDKNTYTFTTAQRMTHKESVFVSTLTRSDPVRTVRPNHPVHPLFQQVEVDEVKILRSCCNIIPMNLLVWVRVIEFILHLPSVLSSCDQYSSIHSVQKIVGSRHLLTTTVAIDVYIIHTPPKITDDLIA